MMDAALQAGSPEIPDKLYFKIGEVSELARGRAARLEVLGNRVSAAVA